MKIIKWKIKPSHQKNLQSISRKGENFLKESITQSAKREQCPFGNLIHLFKRLEVTQSFPTINGWDVFIIIHIRMVSFTKIPLPFISRDKGLGKTILGQKMRPYKEQVGVYEWSKIWWKKMDKNPIILVLVHPGTYFPPSDSSSGLPHFTPIFHILVSL